MKGINTARHTDIGKRILHLDSAPKVVSPGTCFPLLCYSTVGYMTTRLRPIGSSLVGSNVARIIIYVNLTHEYVKIF